jgi:predicted transcriptional regulator
MDKTRVKDLKVDKREMCEIVKQNIEDYSTDERKVVVVSAKTIIVDGNKVKMPPAVFIYQAFAYLAATKLKPATNSVLNYIFSLTGFQNYLQIDQKTLAEEMRMCLKTVNTAIKELVDCNVLMKIKHPNDARRIDYFINPVAAWKGNSKQRESVIRKLKESNKNQLDMFVATELKTFNP